MTKVKITGRNSAGEQRLVETWVNAEPALAADHPKVRGYINNVFRKNGYDTVKVEIVS